MSSILETKPLAGVIVIACYDYTWNASVYVWPTLFNTNDEALQAIKEYEQEYGFGRDTGVEFKTQAVYKQSN